MRKALIIFCVMFFIQPAFCAPKKMIPATGSGDNMLPNIFIYTIPDEDSQPAITEEKDAPDDAYITPKEEEEIVLEEAFLKATTLKGYAQYKEDADTIHLKDNNDEYVLNIKIPQRIASQSLNYGVPSAKPALRYINEEYMIAPKCIRTSSKLGNFTFGAQYNNEVDNIAMLEKETGLFTKYEKKKFALSSSVTQSLNTTYAQDYRTFSIAPELKINKHLSLKNVLSADVTRNKRSSKLVFSVNPLKDTDRMQLEFGAKQTYNLDTESMSTQFSFSTQFKL